MERSLGTEIASMFGARLRRLYEQQGDQGLPAQMRACLDQLKRAEQASAAESRALQMESDGHDASFSFPSPRRSP